MIYLALMVISGILGRMGGSGRFNTKFRDFGCPTVLLVAIVLKFGIVAEFWWAYCLVWILTFATMTTYWDWLFGYDNLAFSGLMVGCAMIPIVFVSPELVWFVAIRAVGLALTWWMLNKFLPQFPLRAAVEEFCRYFASL